MSRIIKEFPYSEKFGDVIVCTAAGVKDIELPNVRVEISRDFQNSELLIEITASAEEDNPGVTITTRAADNNPDDLKGLQASFMMDETEFVDAIYNGIVSDNPIDKNEMIHRILNEAAVTFARANVFPRGYYMKNKNGEWICN